MNHKLSDHRAEVVFEDFKKAYSDQQAVVEANRCLYCYDAPCITACPTGIDIPTFIRRIANENTIGAAKTIFDSNILGMSCARVCPVETLCVGSCVYNHMDSPPIQIGKLQRYATDIAFDAGLTFYEAGEDTGKKVVCIGGGPASLAAAHRLRRYGHQVTIIEKGHFLGGLNTSGIASYKMKADRSLTEVEWLMSIGGIDVRSGVSVPDQVTWHDLKSEFDAIFIGFGLGEDSLMSIPGADSQGVMGAVDFIAKMKLTTLDVSDVTNAVVIGGGNTALDAVRELRGLGVENVTLAYRGGEIQMSGYKHEWSEAKREGVHASWRSQPLSFGHDQGQVNSVTFQMMDENKRPISGQTKVVPADLVLLAIGQGKLGDLTADLVGVEVEWGTITTDEQGATGAGGVYAGGDCHNGGKEVVNAVAEGDQAAQAMHTYLMGGGSCRI
jgi:dihydropyrimidine dehydrogenase (NAD+) subunit PreT